MVGLGGKTVWNVLWLGKREAIWIVYAKRRVEFGTNDQTQRP